MRQYKFLSTTAVRCWSLHRDTTDDQERLPVDARLWRQAVDGNGGMALADTVQAGIVLSLVILEPSYVHYSKEGRQQVEIARLHLAGALDLLCIAEDDYKSHLN
jgi:hypothetical protein